jgi:hypothetical protein
MLALQSSWPVVIASLLLLQHLNRAAAVRFSLDNRAGSYSLGNSLFGLLLEDSGTPNVSFYFDLLPNLWQDQELKTL